MPGSQPDPIKLIFQVERETKNKVRFQEMTPATGTRKAEPVDKDKAVCERIYVSKKTLKKLGNPDTLHATLEAP